MDTTVKFTELRHASELSGEEVVAIAFGGTSYQLPIRRLSTFMGDELNRPGGIINDIKSTALDNMQSIEDARREFMRLVELARAELALGLEEAEQGIADARDDAALAQKAISEALAQVEVINGNAEAAVNDVRGKIDNLESLTEAHDAEITEIAQASAELEASVASAQSQVAALSTQTQAIADSLTRLSADFASNIADFDSRVTALAEETQAVVQQNESLLSRVEDAESSITLTQRVVSLAERTSAFQNAVLQAQTATGSAVTETNRVVAASDTEAVLQEVRQYQVEFEEAEVALRNEVELLASADRAFGQTVDDLRATVGDNTSNITLTQRVVSLAGRTSAFQNAVMQAQNAVGSASIETNRVVAVNERQSIAQQVETFNVEFEDFRATASSEITILADANRSLTQNVESFQSEYQSAVSSINSELSTLADADRSFAQQVNTQLSQFQGNLAGVESEVITLAQDDRAISQRIDTYQTEVNGNISSVQQTLSSMQDPNNGLIAQALTTVSVNGQQGFYALNAFNDEIQFVILADETVVYNTTNGSTSPAFVVRNGQIEANRALLGEAIIGSAQMKDAAIDTAHIKNLSVDRIKIAGNAVTLPISVAANNEIAISQGSSQEILRAVTQADGSNVLVSTSFAATGGDYRVEVRRNGVPVVGRTGTDKSMSISAHVGGLVGSISIFTIQVIGAGPDVTRVYARSLGLLTTYK